MARYPWPKCCVHNNGGEFTGWEFQQLLAKTGVQDVPTTSCNPTANPVYEDMHQTVGNVLRTTLHGNPPENLTRANELIYKVLSTAMHSMQSSVHTTLGSSPGLLVFNRDMYLNIPLVADWHAITTKREHVINSNLMRKNKKRRRFDYQINKKVLKKVHDPTKLGTRTQGPYKIEQVHTNGTLTIQLRPGITERINIQRVTPFYKETMDPA